MQAPVQQPLEYKYNRIKVIGKGSFGEAVLVRNKEDRRRYVAKVWRLQDQVLLVILVSPAMDNSIWGGLLSLPYFSPYRTPLWICTCLDCI